MKLFWGDNGESLWLGYAFGIFAEAVGGQGVPSVQAKMRLTMGTSSHQPLVVCVRHASGGCRLANGGDENKPGYRWSR